MDFELLRWKRPSYGKWWKAISMCSDGKDARLFSHLLPLALSLRTTSQGSHREHRIVVWHTMIGKDKGKEESGCRSSSSSNTGTCSAKPPTSVDKTRILMELITRVAEWRWILETWFRVTIALVVLNDLIPFLHHCRRVQEVQDLESALFLTHFQEKPSQIIFLLLRRKLHLMDRVTFLEKKKSEKC